MTKTIPKYRRPLNPQQTRLLILLYKFRFTTTQLIADSQNSKYRQVINSRLKILLDQAYIARRYDSSYKIKGQPAIYYLANEGIRYLAKQPFAKPKVINSLYHDKRRTDYHINHCLNVFEVYLQLKRQYQDKLKFYSKSELYGRKGLPANLPDALFRLKSKNKHQLYFLDCFEESMSYVHCLVKIKQYISYAEADTWQKTYQTPLPTILLICNSKPLRRRMQRMVNKELETTFADVELMVITKDNKLIGLFDL